MVSLVALNNTEYVLTQVKACLILGALTGTVKGRVLGARPDRVLDTMDVTVLAGLAKVAINAKLRFLLVSNNVFFFLNLKVVLLEFDHRHI